MTAVERIQTKTPVDKLGEIRERIKQFQAEEKALKAIVQDTLGPDDRLLGFEFLAIQTIAERKGAVDERRVADALGVENLDDYRKPATTVITVKTERIE